MTPPLLQLQAVKKHFGEVPVLKGITLDVAPGEFVAVLGPNGAGKSTLFNCVSQVMRPSSGQVRYRGEDVQHCGAAYRRHLGYISHQLFLYGELTGLENLQFFARLYGVEASSRRLEVLLREMGLHHCRDRPVRTYSRGMKQRLAITRALLHEPGLVLLDEPFTGLDQHAATLLAGLLRRLRDEAKTVLMISHQLEHAVQLASRVLFLVNGRIRADLSAGQIDPPDLARRYMEVVEQSGGGRG